MWQEICAIALPGRSTVCKGQASLLRPAYSSNIAASGATAAAMHTCCAAAPHLLVLLRVRAELLHQLAHRCAHLAVVGVHVSRKEVILPRVKHHVALLHRDLCSEEQRRQ
jgi:hypothetical protein